MFMYRAQSGQVVAIHISRSKHLALEMSSLHHLSRFFLGGQQPSNNTLIYTRKVLHRNVAKIRYYLKHGLLV